MGKKIEPTTRTDPREPGRKVTEFQSEQEADDMVEQESEDSFPASDPPSYTPVTHSGNPTHQKSKD